jgi:hypothetical protein
VHPHVLRRVPGPKVGPSLPSACAHPTKSRPVMLSLPQLGLSLDSAYPTCRCSQRGSTNAAPNVLNLLLCSDTEKRGSTEKLAIFGERRGQRGAELKVMSAVEQKMPGCACVHRGL